MVVEEAKIGDRINYSISDELVIEICNVEKKKFYDFINYINEEELANMTPIFYRRVLLDSVVTEVKEKINKLHNYICLEKGTPICFRCEDFEGRVEIDGLVNILKQHGIKRIYEINTGGVVTASYTMDLSAFNPYYIQGFNIYWCTEQLDSLIVKDHEGYFFIYGKCLIDYIKCIWNDWEKYTVHFI